VNQVVRIARIVAPIIEFLGTVVALIAAIIAKGNLNTPDGRVAVIVAIIAAIGHAVNHTTEGVSSGGAPTP